MIVFLLLPFLLSACKKSEETLCIDYYRMSFKDPDSIKLINSRSSGLDQITLTVTATNSYGARLQSELVCVITNNKVNKIRTEAINDYNRTIDRLEKLNESLREQNLRPIRGY